jgi:predicted RNA-binding protein with PIN domain
MLYAMLCYALLCYAMLCYAMLWCSVRLLFRNVQSIYQSMKQARKSSSKNRTNDEHLQPIVSHHGR